MDWDHAPPNGFDETTHTVCWDGDQEILIEDEFGPARLLREHADVSLRHLHVRCGCSVSTQPFSILNDIPNPNHSWES